MAESSWGIFFPSARVLKEEGEKREEEGGGFDSEEDIVDFILLMTPCMQSTDNALQALMFVSSRTI